MGVQGRFKATGDFLRPPVGPRKVQDEKKLLGPVKSKNSPKNGKAYIIHKYGVARSRLRYPWAVPQGSRKPFEGTLVHWKGMRCHLEALLSLVRNLPSEPREGNCGQGRI